MSEVDAREARLRLPDLLERARRGERITITKFGAPVAVLVPPAVHDRDLVKKAVAELRRFRRGRRLGDLTLRDLIDRGRH